uniref:Rho termination factor N-terminal domain-containing protein n=1 Tax=viral metagenome TaxID=1070528 RepID=A0A6C0JYS7_9ZZZZ
MLVALLVYHFKQRVTVLEQKYESLFDIVNGVVKQLSNIQSHQQLVHPSIDQFGGMYHPPWASPEHLGNMNISTDYTNQMFPGEHLQYNDPHVEPIINYSIKEDSNDSNNEESNDDNESSDYEDDEDASSDDENDEDESGDDENDDDDSENNVYKIIVSDDENDAQSGVKIINLLVDERSAHLLVDERSAHLEEYDITPVNLDETDELYELPLQDVKHNYSIEEESPIVVKKIEDNIQEISETTFIERASSKDLYKKMTLSNLKATVISKGLCSDPSKMKKNELLKLLEDE